MYTELSSFTKQKVYKEQVRLLSTLKKIERERTNYLDHHTVECRTVKLDLEQSLGKPNEKRLDSKKEIETFNGLRKKLHCLHVGKVSKFAFENSDNEETHGPSTCKRNCKTTPPTSKKNSKRESSDLQSALQVNGTIMERRISLPTEKHKLCASIYPSNGGNGEATILNLSVRRTSYGEVQTWELLPGDTDSTLPSAAQNSGGRSDQAVSSKQKHPIPGDAGFGLPQLQLGTRKHVTKTIDDSANEVRATSQALCKQDDDLPKIQNWMSNVVVSQQTNIPRSSPRRASVVSTFSNATSWRSVPDNNTDFGTSLKIKRLYSEPKRQILRKMAAEENERLKKKRNSLPSPNEFRRINLNNPNPDQPLYRLHAILQNSARLPLISND